MRRAAVFLLGLLWFLSSGCAANMPQRAPARATSDEERRSIASVLAPLLVSSGVWHGPADGCAVALGIVPVDAINLGVAPHP